MIARRFSLVLVGGLLAASGCGGTAKTPTGPTGAPPTTAAAASGECGGVIDKVRQAVAKLPTTSIGSVAACTTIVINTDLENTDLSTGQQLCDAAAAVAYTGVTSSVTIQAKSGKELAIGLKGSPCISEP